MLKNIDLEDIFRMEIVIAISLFIFAWILVGWFKQIRKDIKKLNKKLDPIVSKKQK